MNSTFLICGYPRSRTMWLSKFLTVEGISVCTHEATEFAGSVDEFWRNAESYAQGMDIYGNSDSANIFVLPSLLAEKPLTRVVWVDRPITEVANSMANIGMPFNETGLRNLMTMREMYEEHFDLVVDYEELRIGDVCKMIWEFCLSGIEFDWARWGVFQHQKLGYSKENPMPPKHFQKFLDWVKRDIDELKQEQTR